MKRFTETEKWKDTWFRKLKPSEKLLWIYILDNCDNAGFHDFDPEFCAFVTGMTDKQIEGAIKGLDRGLLGAKSGNVFMVKNFLRHQKNDTLNPENNAHKQIIRIIEEKNPLFKEDLGAYLGLNSPTGKGKGNGNSNGKDKKKVEYTLDFETWWKECGKGSKSNAFKRWNEQTEKPSTEELIEIHKKYVSHCSDEERSLKDSEGWINGRFWDGKWNKSQAPKPASTTAEDCAKILKEYPQ